MAYAPLDLVLPAVRESVPRARERATEWAAPLVRSSEQLHALGLAVTEGVANAVLHAYPDGYRGPIRLWLEAGEDLLHVVIEDDGEGMRPRLDSPGLGLGLPLLGNLTDSLEIASPPTGDSGCEVRMTFRI